MRITVLMAEDTQLLKGCQGLAQRGEFDLQPFQITAAVSTGDDAWLHGLRMCPHLDSAIYSLAGISDPESPANLRSDSYHCADQLREYGMQPSWASFGDKSLATHLMRTELLDAGYTLTQITEALAQRWGVPVAILPATDFPVETHVVVPGLDRQHPDQRTALHIQEWLNKYATPPEPKGFAFVGAEKASAGEKILETLNDSDLILLAPDDPITGLGPILAVPGIRSALRNTSASVIGFSPVTQHHPPSTQMLFSLKTVGAQPTSTGIANYHGARTTTGILDGWITDTNDTVALPGIRVAASPLPMTTMDEAMSAITVACKLGKTIKSERH